MRHLTATLLCCTLIACSGDSTPLPPIAIGPQWMPLMMDTTGNLMLRRMALFVDTANVTKSASGYMQTRQKLVMDMKMGGMSTTMQMRADLDCAGNRFRIAGMDSMTASIKGVAMPDSVARQAMAQQQTKTVTDTNWKAVATASGENAAMLKAVCAKGATLK
jgi:hypothetical protein